MANKKISKKTITKVMVFLEKIKKKKDEDMVTKPRQ
jgi:hypothetical protein